MKILTKLDLELRKTNFRNRIMVSFYDPELKKNVPLGFLYEKVKKFRWVAYAFQNQHQIRCIFIKYHPIQYRYYYEENEEVKGDQIIDLEESIEGTKIKYSFRDPARADLSIEIQDNLKMGQIFKGLFELLELGHPNLTNAFLRLGPSIRHLLEEESRLKSGDVLAQIQNTIAEFDRRHKIPLSKDYTILL